MLLLNFLNLMCHLSYVFACVLVPGKLFFVVVDAFPLRHDIMGVSVCLNWF